VHSAGGKKSASSFAGLDSKHALFPVPALPQSHLKTKVAFVDGKLTVQQAPAVNIIQASRDNAMALANENREIQVIDQGSAHVRLQSY